MFTEQQPDFTGRHYRIAQARNVPRPLQPGGPPIMIGGSGERRTLKLVAQYADMCNVTGGPDTVRHKLEVLSTHCATVGRDPSEITTTRMGTLVVTPDADETGRIVTFLRGIAGDGYEEQFTVGEPAEVVEQVATLVDTGLDCLIFNMPLSDPETVASTGELLVSRFG
jgi:alkanesulfonate monooxygenase SsuD/methylene tetrahydromethanopterin reductase-like flavin-dependent oxidoreductase (luciferase family)